MPNVIWTREGSGRSTAGAGLRAGPCDCGSTLFPVPSVFGEELWVERRGDGAEVGEGTEVGDGAGVEGVSDSWTWLSVSGMYSSSFKQDLFEAN